MKRTLTLSGLVAAGVLSVAVSASQAPTPAAPQGPRVIDLLKLKDNFYVLTSAIPGAARIPSAAATSRCSSPTPA